MIWEVGGLFSWGSAAAAGRGTPTDVHCLPPVCLVLDSPLPQLVLLQAGLGGLPDGILQILTPQAFELLLTMPFSGQGVTPSWMVTLCLMATWPEEPTCHMF